ncbi:MAG: UMP kinase [Vulcanimicrobiota bacterium]
MSRYKRVLLKLSGETLAGENKAGIDNDTLEIFAGEVKRVVQSGVQLGIVVGGGNFWRGRTARDMDRATADQMGMMATVINALGLRDALDRIHIPSRVLTSIEIKDVAEPFIRLRAIRHLEKGYVVIFGGGTGHPYFTTDTAAALRALEMKADVLLKATKVKGIYDKDPEKFEDAKYFSKLTYQKALELGVKVMDSTALSLCMDNHLPIQVFNVNERGNLLKAVSGEKVGTVVDID